MDTEVKSLANIKAMEGRNLDSSVDGNTLVSGEKADGTFGVFNFFQGIKNFFKGISALGTLASGSRLPVTDSNGNVTYTTMNDINNYVVNNTLTDYPQKTNYTYCKSNDIVRITDGPILTEDKYYLLQEFSVTWQGIQKIEILLGYDASYEKTRVILTLDNRYVTNPRVISYYDNPQGLNYVDFFVSNDGNKTYLYARGFKGKNYITFIILDRNFSLKSNYNVPSNSYIGNVIHTVSTNGGKIVTGSDIKSVEYEVKPDTDISTGSVNGARFFQKEVLLNSLVSGLNVTRIKGVYIDYIYSSADYIPLPFVVGDKLYVNLYCARTNQIVRAVTQVIIKIIYI